MTKCAVCFIIQHHLKGGKILRRMKPNQKKWTESRDRLASAVSSLGYPAEFADLLARELGSPKTIDRMTSYILQARPGSVEMIVDEMLTITAEIDAWREKKESREAQESYNTWLNSDIRWQNTEDE